MSIQESLIKTEQANYTTNTDQVTKKHRAWKITILIIVSIMMLSAICIATYIGIESKDSKQNNAICDLPLCYLENEENGIFARKEGNPECWKPPSCFRRSSSCLMYLSYGIGDHCATNRPVINTTDGSIHYKCEYTYHPPTPRPTPPPLPPSLMQKNEDINLYEFAQQYDGSKRKLLSALSTTNCSIPSCYYDNPGTFAREVGEPNCWQPPACFHSSSQCLMYISAGGIGDHCASNKATVNVTDGSTTFKCEYTYRPPTPRPTPPPVPTTPPGTDVKLSE